MPKLTWTCGDQSGSVDLTARLTFGRGPDNGLVLPDKNVSRHHGTIEPDPSGSGWRVVDAGSSNGILFQGTKTATFALANGAEFAAGETRFRFESPETFGVERTVLMGTPAPPPLPPAVAAAPPVPVGPPPLPLSPSTAAPAGKNPPWAGIAIAILAVLGLVWFLGRSKDSAPKPGGDTGIFASDEEKEIAKLSAELADENYTVRWAAYEKLKTKGQKPDPVPLWILDLKLHADDDVRERAAEKLGAARDARAVPQLRWSAENDSDWNVRREAEDALEKMGIKI